MKLYSMLTARFGRHKISSPVHPALVAQFECVCSCFAPVAAPAVCLGMGGKAQVRPSVMCVQAREHLQAAEQRSEPAAHAASHWGEEDSPRERWDCESVLTALSNLDNHPGKITEPPRSKQGPKQRIHLSAKSGLPVRHAEPAQGGEQQAGPGVGQLRHPAMPRRQGETPEQKRERKAAVKDARVRAQPLCPLTKALAWE